MSGTSLSREPRGFRLDLFVGMTASRPIRASGLLLFETPDQKGRMRFRRGVARQLCSQIVYGFWLWPLLSGFCYRPCPWAGAMPCAAMMNRLRIVITEDFV